MSGQKIINGLNDAIEGRGTTLVHHVRLTREQLAYEHAKSVGWNEAIRAAVAAIETHHDFTGLTKAIADHVRQLDRSMQAIDD